MSDRRVTKAVVLAAGTGSRLGEGAAPTPKPLRPAACVPLLVRVLRTLQSAGIREAVVVIGHQGDAVRRALTAEPTLGLELVFVRNDRFLAKNGVSLLAAADYVDGECLLTMSDHLYSPELVRRLIAAEIPAGHCALAVDYDVDRCFDIDDATKVCVAQGRISDINKELDSYDAIDTGVFRIGPALIEELQKLDAKHGDCSLSDGVRALAARGAFHAVDVGDVRWIDVDTPAALERAEAMLRVFGDHLGDEPGAGAPAVIDAEALETFAPTWVRAAKPYNEDHFALANKTGVLRMMSNESPFEPSPRVIDAIVQAAVRGHLYPAGGPALRTRLGEREGMNGDNVILGAGSTELIDLVIRTFVSPGEEVLLSVPTFSMYEARTRVVGGIPVLVPMTEDHEHDMLGLLRGVTERTKVIFLCTPNNPTGNRIAEDDLRRILRLGLPTVIDEAYYELGHGTSLSYLTQQFPNAIVLRTFSKAYGLAGLRVGYAIGHAAVIRLLSRVKVPWNVPEIAMPSEGNFILVDISQTQMRVEEVVNAMLSEGILIRSLVSHHAERSYVRITIGTREQNARCVSAFGRIVSRRGHVESRIPAFVGGDAE
jgi:histidinol-phosphate/aromatic aminotransferase/cobyric acid decarboxylase-like protein/choline kinase